MSIGTQLTTLLSTCAVLSFVGDVTADATKNRYPSKPCFHHSKSGDTIYNYQLTDLHTDQNVSLNFAKESYKDLVIIGVPCNQFELQEPGNNASEILNGIKHVRPGGNFVPSFQLYKKTDVNGKNEEPLYTYLKKYCPTTRDYFSETKELYWSPVKNNDIRWNWEKFLISKRGIPYMRYDASTEPSFIRPDIELLLQEDI